MLVGVMICALEDVDFKDLSELSMRCIVSTSCIFGLIELGPDDFGFVWCIHIFSLSSSFWKLVVVQELSICLEAFLKAQSFHLCKGAFK